MNNPEILYEDNHLIAINKQSGEIAQGDRTGDEPLPEKIKTFIKQRDSKPGQVFLGVVHRLDRPVSGVILFAKTSKALERLSRMFREREVRKTYLAITAKRPDPPYGTLRQFMIKDNSRNKSRIVKRGTEGAKEALLDYRLLESHSNFHLLEVNPHTGRPHQIRVQLSALGCPIAGDLRYGYSSPNTDASVSLHATRLELIHPVRKTPLDINADSPLSDPWNFFR